MNPSDRTRRFELWVHAHAAMLHHVANGFAAGADRHDLMQELLLALWRAVPAFRDEAQAATFVYRVAHNAALTWKRSETGRQRRAIELQAAPAPDDARERETLEQLYAQIRALPPVDRSLVLLSLDGVDYATMAAIHGLSASNVGVRLNRARQKLAAAMKGGNR